MSSANRNRPNNQNTPRCGVDGSSIFYDDSTIDLKSNPDKVKPKSAFEAVFLGDVIDEISGQCFTVQQNCKGLVPKVDPKNWGKWLTSVDQENRMSLAHTIEKSSVPILYNTPRLCDPGITISKNWNLKNYIETRLYLFKYKYDLGKSVKVRNTDRCYPGVVFDFRPFQFVLKPGKWNKPGKNGELAKPIYVTEWITIDSNSGAEGYTPHMMLSDSPNATKNNRPIVNRGGGSKKLLRKMVENIIDGKLFGISQKSVIKNALYLGPNKATGTNNNNNRIMNRTSYLDKFMQFLEDYDGVRYGEEIFNNSNPRRTPVVTCDEDVIRVMFYDLLHDKVVPKGSLSQFQTKFRRDFYGFSSFKINKWAGAATVGNSYRTHGSILRMNPRTKSKVEQIPAICKTFGDLAQFLYASKENTIVASGDKMGIATGLYINAKRGKKVKCMMEDVITGFIIYTGLDTITFTSRDTCNNSTNNTKGQCFRNSRSITRPGIISGQIRQDVGDGQRGANKRDQVTKIINSKPRGIKSMLSLLNNSRRNQTPNTIRSIQVNVSKILNYLAEDDIKKLIPILKNYSTRNGVNAATQQKLSEMIGKLGARVNSPISVRSGQRRSRNNNSNGRNAKRRG
tara:strand:- start:44 stop:1912 length:1869 start_codon:yes stop_codon:yes gene_type:complete